MPVIPEFLVLLLLLGLVGLPILAVIDAAVRPASAWRAAGESKVVWILLSWFLGVIGACIYLLVIRPRVAAAE
jgi:hypothetical protein